jgi:hypothetical protein
MSSKSDAFEADLLKLIFNAVSIADICTTAGAANLSVALHLTTPNEGGTQLVGEVSYTGYLRVNVVRTTSGWVVTGSSVSPFAPITFGECTGGTLGTINFFSVGTGVANKMLYYGPVSPGIVLANGVVPQLKITSFITED